MSAAVVDVLRAARERVARGWTTEAHARRADGVSVPSVSPEATCWCAIGGIYAVTARNEDPRRLAAFLALRAQTPGDICVADYNDLPTTTQADVVALFDRAIASAEGASQ